jgi:anaerobic magnesium-protoporphyrin IX monomethyl ester cyclase
VAGYLDWLAGGPRPPGVVLRTADGWSAPAERGVFLDPDDWVLPDVGEIPYAAYEAMYHRDQNKFCGIPSRRELVGPAARGCPIGCHFCEVPGLYGAAERRLGVDRVISYIEESFTRQPFEYVAFYAPTFTLDRGWTVRLCQALDSLGSPFPWKCATTMHHLDEELITLMARSGCVRVSVGLETLDEATHPSLPRIKRIHEERLDQLAGWCRDNGIELNCFVIAGLPGTTPAGVHRTVEAVRAHGARVRPTMYNPLHDMRPDMSEAQLAKFNRQLLVSEVERTEAADLYDVIFGVEPKPTTVMERIPMRRGS